jgi:hypothetical protein
LLRLFGIHTSRLDEICASFTMNVVLYARMYVPAVRRLVSALDSVTLENATANKTHAQNRKLKHRR